MDSKSVEKFWKYVDKNGPIHPVCGQCWVTTASPNVARAQIRIRGIKIRVSRVSWEIHNGPAPEGMNILHKCDNPRCVNPDHLFLGTQYDNVRDCIDKGRSRKCHGELHSCTHLTEKDIVDIRNVYAEESYSQKSLAEFYGVTQGTIGKIIRRRTWKHVRP